MLIAFLRNYVYAYKRICIINDLCVELKRRLPLVVIQYETASPVRDVVFLFRFFCWGVQFLKGMSYICVRDLLLFQSAVLRIGFQYGKQFQFRFVQVFVCIHRFWSCTWNRKLMPRIICGHVHQKRFRFRKHPPEEGKDHQAVFVQVAVIEDTAVLHPFRPLCRRRCESAAEDAHVSLFQRERQVYRKVFYYEYTSCIGKVRLCIQVAECLDGDGPLFFSVQIVSTSIPSHDVQYHDMLLMVVMVERALLYFAVRLLRSFSLSATAAFSSERSSFSLVL